MGRMAAVVLATALLAACGGDEPLDPGDLDGGTTTEPAGTLPEVTFTVPTEDGSDITVIAGGGAGTAQVGDDAYTFTVLQCLLAEGQLVFAGEGEGIAVGLVTGAGLNVVTDPNGDSVVYAIPMPEISVDGNVVSASGQAAGLSATGATGVESVEVRAEC